MKKIYLACPYTHETKATEAYRYEMATRAAGKLFQEGHLPYSPITHGHSITVRNSNIGGTFETHKAHCLSFLESWAEEIWVLTLDGWENSEGVKAEVTFARSKNLPVKKISLEELGIK